MRQCIWKLKIVRHAGVFNRYLRVESKLYHILNILFCIEWQVAIIFAVDLKITQEILREDSQHYELKITFSRKHQFSITFHIKRFSRLKNLNLQKISLGGKFKLCNLAKKLVGNLMLKIKDYFFQEKATSKGD